MASPSELARRLASVRSRITAAAERVGRDPRAVTLVAVAKTHPAETVAALAALGQHHFGENYGQELRDKARALSAKTGLTWHFVGGMQRNKVKYVVGTAALIHSVDSLELAIEIEQRAARLHLTQDILLEVNVASEPQKRGVLPPGYSVPTDANAQLSLPPSVSGERRNHDLGELLAETATLPHLRVVGLMTMGPLQEDPEKSRPHFRTLADLARKWSSPERPLGLSMGMSQDFEVAIEEGATWVRVGTALFGPR